MLNFSIYFQREFLFYAIIWKRQTETFITKTRRKVLKVAINRGTVEPLNSRHNQTPPPIRNRVKFYYEQLNDELDFASHLFHQLNLK